MLLVIAVFKFRTMITDEIRDLIHAEPFKPVRIILDDTGTYVVSHIDYLAISPDRQTLVLYDENGHFRVLNAQQIKLVEPVQDGQSKAA